MGLKIDIAPAAQEAIRDLPRDAKLLRLMWRRLEEMAADPGQFTEPGVYPVSPRRRMGNFEIVDTAGRRWGFTVVVAVTPDRLEVLVVRGAQFDFPDAIAAPL